MDNSTGVIGEDFTAKYLKKHGYKIVNRNFKTKYGEIDIIATKDEYIVFVEVKTRDKNYLYSPVEAVNYYKRKKIITTASIYLQESVSELQPRFDISSVITDRKKPISIEYLENAFWADE